LLMVSEGRSQQYQSPEMLRYNLNSQLYMIESEDVLRQAIATIGPQTLLYHQEAKSSTDRSLAEVQSALSADGSLDDIAFLKFRKQLTASAEKDSQVFKVSFRHWDPEVAKRFLRAVIEAFLQRRANLSGNADALSFSDGQAKKDGSEYESASARLSAF